MSIDDVSLNRELADLSANVKHILKNQETIMGTFERHENRIRTLETAHSKLLGMGAMVAVIVSAMVEWVKHRV